MTNPVFVALDTTDPEQARRIAAQVAGQVGGLKLGLEYFSANGPAGVQALAGFGLPLFLDLKLHDIPNTVAKAIHALRPLAPAILTVHGAGGRAMLEAAKAAAPAGDQNRRRHRAHQPRQRRSRRAPASTAVRTARSSGSPTSPATPGSTASSARAMKWRGQEARPTAVFVVPGVRPAEVSRRRPEERHHPARGDDRGASILVIGRPITEAPDPDEAARTIAASL